MHDSVYAALQDITIVSVQNVQTEGEQPIIAYVNQNIKSNNRSTLKLDRIKRKCHPVDLKKGLNYQPWPLW